MPWECCSGKATQRPCQCGPGSGPYMATVPVSALSAFFCPLPLVLLTGPKDSESFWEASREESGILPTWTQLCYVTLYQSLELPGPRCP